VELLATRTTTTTKHEQQRQQTFFIGYIINPAGFVLCSQQETPQLCIATTTMFKCNFGRARERESEIKIGDLKPTEAKFTTKGVLQSL